MRNQPFSQYDELAGGQDVHDPRRRLQIVSAVLIVGFLGIAVRVVHVQSQLAPRFLARWDQTTEQTEVIPARNGRIVARDGVVLARDATRYDVALQYRWLESPSDPQWLRKQIWRQLSPTDRTDRQKVESARRRMQAQRETLLNDLASFASVDRAELDARAAAIQQRIERMATAVEERRTARRSDESHSDDPGGSPAARLWRQLVSELTTPPDRASEDPIILKEELQPHVLLEDVSLAVASAIQSQPGRFPGVSVQATASREYPLGSLAAHVIGLRRSSNANTAPVMHGESGLERAYDDHLTGGPGRREILVDRRGDLVAESVRQAPRHGADIVLTLDSRLQRAAEQLLDAALNQTNHEGQDSRPTGACLIALDVWTGAVLTLASSPRPSLSIASDPSVEEWQALLDDPRRPLFPRTVQMALPAGSIFKVVTAAAALESGEITPDEMFHCQGYLESPDEFRCLIYRRYGRGHGDVSLTDALCESCNVFFFDAAQRVGPAPILTWARRFGFGHPTGIDLPHETAGHLPRLPDGNDGSTWYPGMTMQLAIGQGTVQVSPLQVARMMASIANGGYLVTPHLVQPDPQQTQSLTRQKIDGLSERTLFAIRVGLERVVQDPRGTGRQARVAGLTMAGKTGTAEVADHPDHAWFAGYVPAHAPRIAFAVVLEHGGAGSDAAAVIRDFAIELLGCGYLRPDEADRRETRNDSEQPFDRLARSRDTE